jgi:carbamoyl-phosphate synthase small subunit
MSNEPKKAYLVLSDGTVFEGKRFGSERDSIGELVFTTGVVGYIETLTDPSFYGQIIMQTFPMIGNYGIIEEDFEGDCVCNGYVVREWTDEPSNFRAEYDIDKFLKDRDVPGIYGIDTRELTRLIRDKGVMNAIICSEPPADLTEVKEYEVKNAVSSVTCLEEYTVPAEGEKKYNVTLIDYGAKKNIARKLTRRGCEVRVVPSTTTAAEILSRDPDGIMLSNGPGDPEENVECIAELKKMISKVPIFGICLGHQLMALAFGGRTYKLKYGHRGGNQPATDLDGSGRTFITTQNHGYAVDADSLKGVGVQTFVNANDGTCEGMKYEDMGCYSVQFHPEAHAGPHDTGYLFDRFVEMMEKRKK